ncbi:hypothetical protein BD779DRAFT_1731053 [Infundibulicybe gibba]|nr:hypothetical protein BD779DRAFT_1731053 [Infundibulicybe gibba]
MCIVSTSSPLWHRRLSVYIRTYPCHYRSSNKSATRIQHLSDSTHKFTMPASYPSQTGHSPARTPAQQRAPSCRDDASFTNPQPRRAIWPAAILAAIAAEERTSHSSVESLPEDPNAWDWGRFFSDLAQDVRWDRLGALLDEQVLDEFLRKFPHAMDMATGRRADRRVAFHDGPPPPAPTSSTFGGAQMRRPDPRGDFRGGPPPPAPTVSSFSLPPYPSTRGGPPGGPPPPAPSGGSFHPSPSRRPGSREPFAGGPPPLAPTTASFSFSSVPYPGPSGPRGIPAGLLRRAALRATGKYIF